MLAVGARSVLAHERAPAEEVLLVLGDDPVHAEVDRRDRAVGVLADDDVALLGAQHVHRLGAVRRDAEALADIHQRFPNVPCLVAHVDLVRELAGEADPHHARRHAGDEALSHDMNGKASAEKSMSAHTASSTLRLSGPTTATVAQCSVTDVRYTFRCGHSVCSQSLEPRHHACRAAGGRGHQEMVVGEARGDAVVHHHAVLVAASGRSGSGPRRAWSTRWCRPS